MQQRLTIIVSLIPVLTCSLRAPAQPCIGTEPPSTACTLARVIPGTPGHHVVMMDVSTATGTSTICNGIFSGHNVWFEVTPDQSGPMTITTCHPMTQYDTVLQVYRGGDSQCDFMITVTCNDDDPTSGVCTSSNCGPRSSTALVQAQAGTRYRFVVGSYGNSITSPCQPCLGVRVSIGAPCGDPPNNFVASVAEQIPGTPGVYAAQVDVTDAATLPSEPAPACVGPSIGNSVWYTLTPEEPGMLTVSTCNSDTNFDTVAAVYEDGGVGLLLSRGCNDDDSDSSCDTCPGGTYGSIISTAVEANHTYLVQVGSYGDNQWNCPPPLCLGVEITLQSICEFDVTSPEIALFTPPEITSGCTCSGLPIEGWAYDTDDTFDQWWVEYRAIGTSAWNVIATGSNEIPQPGGTLATWPLGELTQGYYELRLTAANACSRSVSMQRVVWSDTGFDTVQATTSGGPIVAGQACISGTVTDNFCFDHYAVDYRATGGAVFQPVDATQPVYTTGVINSTLATWQTAARPDGDYEVRVAGETDCGDEAAVTFVVTVDNTQPTALIASPPNCENVDGVVQIIGTADDANLSSWSLQYTGGASNGWTVINNGISPVINNVLGSWDVSGLPACAYALRLVVTDEAARLCDGNLHNSSTYTTVVMVGSCRGDFNDDAQFDSLDIQGFVNALLSGESCP